MAVPHDYHAAALPTHVGHDFGISTPIRIDQAKIDQFAQCTGDDQWIHVDVPRSRAEGPFGTTIAHGFLVLSLIPVVQYELGVYPHDARSMLNYGIDKVRFLAPVPADSSVAMRVQLSAVESKGAGRFLVRCTNTAFILETPEKPVMVAESLAMVLA